jgi:hypothetical protein
MEGRHCKLDFGWNADPFIAASGDGQVRVLKENGEKVRSLEGANDFMNSAAATPDGR